MAEVSHNGRRKPRPWTAQEQATLEVAAACGVPLAKIEPVLNRPKQTLHRKIKPDPRKQGRALTRRPWKPQDQVNLEVAAACGVAISHLAILWKRSEAHMSAKLNYQLRDSRKKLCQAWRKENREHCLSYSRQYGSRWRLANPERYKKINQLYYQTNKLRLQRQNLEWRTKNAERKRQIDRQYYEANKDKIKAQSKEYAKRHKTRLAQVGKLWKQQNIEKVKEYARRARARRRATGKPLVRATPQCILKLRALWNYRCAYCGEKGPLTDDHVLPVAHGGLDEIGNMIPACQSCNSSKQARPVEDWYRAQPFFSETRWRKIQQHCPAAVTGQLSIPIGA